jgi:GH24 family phage-related lysozyme (muramidase)
MAGFCPSGPMCTVLNDLWWIDSGTTCRQCTPPPGLIPGDQELKTAKARDAHHKSTRAAAKPVPATAAGFLKEIKVFEGIVRHMYRDSKGLVTVGIGFLIENKFTHAITDEGKKMPFVVANTAQPAGESQILADFDTVIKQPYINSRGKPFPAAHFKKGVTKLEVELSENYINDRFNELVASFWNELQVEYPLFNTYPMPVQFALLDMIFNLGRGKEWKEKKSGKIKSNGIHKYQDLRRALNVPDWKKAGDSCHRGGIDNTRNMRIQEWFNDGVLHSQPVLAGQMPPSVNAK